MDNSSDNGGFHRGPGAENLRRAEENAKEAKVDGVEGSTRGAQEAETGVRVPQSFYHADAGDKKGNKNNRKKFSIRGLLKEKGVVGAIIGFIVMITVMMAGSQSMQLISWASLVKSAYNTHMQTSAATRATDMLKVQLSPTESVKKYEGTEVFGKDNLALSEMQRADFEESGIKTEDNGNGTSTLSYTDDGGDVKLVTAENVEDVIETDANFSNKYTSGSRSWRGAIANWFNKITDRFINSNNLTRNLFKFFKERTVKAGGNARAVMIEDMGKRGNGDVVSKASENSVYQENQENEVEVNKEPELETVPGDKTKQNVGEAEIKTKVSNIAKGLAKANQIVNVRCTVGTILNAINLLVMAKESLQVINLATSYLEAVDKTKAGEGVDSPMNEMGNSVNQKNAEVYTEYKYSDTGGKELMDGSGEGDDNDRQSEDLLKNFKIESQSTTESNKSAVESASWVSLYSGQPMNVNDPSVKNLSFNAGMSGIMNSMGLSPSNFATCLKVKAVVGTASGIVGLIPGVGQGWSITKAFLNAGVSVAISLAVQTLVPVIASFWTRDLITNIGGESLGNALVDGASKYIGTEYLANGGLLATKEVYTDSVGLRQKVIAENAKYERENKSPFDASSQYTFMGTIARQMYSLSASNSFLSTLASAATTLSSSIMNLTPAALAYDTEKELSFSNSDEFAERCPYLAAINAVGDEFCNPKTVSDVSTITMDPGEVVDKVSDNLDEKGKIKKDSDLAKYIAFCNNRTSTFGVPDNQIVYKVSSVSGSYELDTAIGQVPGLNIAQNLWENTQGLAYLGYITGESCVAGNDMNLNGITDVVNKSPDWEDTAKYYQRFIEDQALMETMGVTEKSVVTAFLDEYYKENPVDNSYEGILARYSGLSKDEVIAYLDFMDYCEYIANYDASERYAFNQDDIDLPEKPLVEEKDFDEDLFVLLSNITYADVRNRQTIA